VNDVAPFALAVLVAASAGLLVVVAARLAELSRVPLPALVLLATSVVVAVAPGLHRPAAGTVVRVVDLALVCVLFDGGMRIGAARMRASAGPVVTIGLLGTFATAAAGSVLVHDAFGIGWYPAALTATAVAPTDPTVVFSVLGRRQITGRAGTILEGEAGANDPVGIALIASLVAAGSLNASSVGQVAGTFAVQMAVGAAVGVGGGIGLVRFAGRVSLPSEALYPLRTLAFAAGLFGLAEVLHGSGFLAVFVAGVAVGDEPLLHKKEIERFHAALASLGEIVAFVVLGLTVHLGVLAQPSVWGPGVALGFALALVVRPVVAAACLAPASLGRNERAFVAFAGLKGAVPILLGLSLFDAGVADPGRLYGIVVVVVVFSVVVQGGLTGTALRVLRVPVVSTSSSDPGSA
jgi:cell volume regulation protein A